MSFLYEVSTFLIDLGILFYVAKEYYASEELNQKLNKVYKAKKKKLDANHLVKAIVQSEVTNNA